MLEIIDVPQGSPEWRQARAGVVTASCFADVLAKGQGKTRRTYMMKLAGELITGEATESYSNGHMERGNAMEEEAVSLYEMRFDVECARVGFMRNGRVGCSPDRLLGDKRLVQIKTALPHIHAETLLAGEMPSGHRAQVQGELWVSGRESSDFVQYWPRMPLFVKTVHRDERYICELERECAAFVQELDDVVARLRAMA